MESSIVQPGTLGGLNPSDDVDAELAELSGQGDGAGEPAAPVEERETPEPDATAGKKPTSPARQYVVLLVDVFEDGTEYDVQIGEVESRNAQNALRKAARELRAKLNGDTAVLRVVPKTQWRKHTVTLTVNESISVSIG